MKQHLDFNCMKKIILYTLVWCLVAHGYRYLNDFYSHDSVMIIQADRTWQISIGRFLQQFYMVIRGKLTSAYLIGGVAVLFLSFSNYIVVKMFRFSEKIQHILVCGILSTNYVVTLGNATYMPWADVYMIALFFAVIGVHLFDNYKYGYIFVPMSIIMTCGLYQAYFSVTIALFMSILIRDVFEHQETRKVVIKGFKAISLMIIGLASYYMIYRFSLYFFGISPADTYNSIEVSFTTETSIIRILLDSYYSVLYSIIMPITFNRVISSIATIALVLTCGISLYRYIRYSMLDRITIILFIITIILLPFGMNISQILSLGEVSHELMNYGFVFFYVLILLVFNYTEIKEKSGQLTKWTNSIMVCAFSILLYNNVVYANQVYLLKELEYENTLSTVTRIVNRLETYEDYVVGESVIVFVGELDESSLSLDRVGFEHIYGVGTTFNFSLTYYGTYRYYFNSIYAYPIVIADNSVSQSYSEMQEVQEMPSFPSLDSIQTIDGRIVVKLS